MYSRVLLFGLISLLITGLLAAGCTPKEPAPAPSPIEPTPALTPPPMPTPPTQTDVLPEEPVLSTALKRGCPLTATRSDFDDVGLETGEPAVNFALMDIHGREFVLSRLLAKRPVMMVFGSFT